ncbi:MSCRAMM family protein [Terrisporobacter vanillatitrophus]|uniref:MSCRAMM family protein n=1 Tax=Terrisporobacter vanillatitrophus TaxID=3058402 RepID=UPI00336667F1
MVIKDIFLLQQSDEFFVNPREEVTIYLSLTRVPVIPNTMLTGTVCSDTGFPIRGAIVKVFSVDYVPIEHTITNDFGNFCFKNILPPGKYNIIATADDYRVSNAYQVNIWPNNRVSLCINLYKNDILNSATLYGIVREEIGTTICDATVIISDYDNPKKTIAITHSNSDGEYLAYGLKAGKYWVLASKKDYVFYEKILVSIDTKQILNLDLFLYEVIDSRKGTISGQITSKGIAVPYAVVGLYSIDGNKHTLIQIKESNNEGMYLFADVAPGKYLVKSNKASVELCE